MGPMWFTDVSPRWHSPVKNNIVMLAMSEIGIFIYAYWASAIDAIAIVALEAMSAWGVMAVSGLLFPYVKKARTIWEASPYKFHLGPLYVMTVASLINLAFVGILIYYFFTEPELGAISTWGSVVYIIDMDHRSALVRPLGQTLEETGDRPRHGLEGAASGLGIR